MEKEVKLIFADKKIMDAYYSLENGTSEDKNLFKWLSRAFEDILENPFCGIRIPKKQMPKEYIENYEKPHILFVLLKR